MATKTFTWYVKTDAGFWGMGNTLADALAAADYNPKRDTAHAWKGKGIYWKADHIGAVADSWENDGSEYLTIIKGVEYVRMPECPKGKAKAEKHRHF